MPETWPEWVGGVGFLVLVFLILLGDAWLSYTIKDSGKREEFQTGARRDTRDGKGRFDLLSPVANRRKAVHFQKGAEKYGDRNWEQGMPLGRLLDSALRHLNSYLEGKDDEDHLVAAGWNLDAALHVEEGAREGKYPADLLDCGPYTAVTEPEVGDPGDESPICDCPFNPRCGPGQEKCRTSQETSMPSGFVLEGLWREVKAPDSPPPGPKKPKLIYVAGKYTDPRGSYYVEQNIRWAEDIARQLWQMGAGVICPHTNTRHFDGAATWEQFMAGDLVMVERCDALVMVPNWLDSKGARMEADHAFANRVRVFLWPADRDEIEAFIQGS